MQVDMTQATLVGENITCATGKDDQGKTVMVFVVDPTINLGLSNGGKMNGIASSGGFTVIPGGLKLNLYLGRKAR